VNYNNFNTLTYGQTVYGPQVSDFSLCMFDSIPELTMFVDFTVNVHLTEQYSDANQMYFSLYTFPGGLCSSLPHEILGQGTQVCAGILDSATTVNFTNTTGDPYLVMQVYYEDFDSVAFTIDYLRIAVDRGRLLNVETHALDQLKVIGAERQLTVDLPHHTPYQLSVTNLLGQTIYRENARGKTSIPVNQSGVYLVSAMVDDHRVTKKVWVR